MTIHSSFVNRRFRLKMVGVGFVVHTCVVHFVDSHEILSRCLATPRFRPLRQKPIGIINCYSPTSAAEKSELDDWNWN
ncbi:hypothetical protein RB195_010438 [Necator americanus]|uniref:Uncharacterized protein n=1 Tax=Necator americanus TaxID=51031 RepID=A0ABR1CYP9_NECAM